MKKHLFLLTSFMATSLVTANTLLVISCKAKAIKDTTNDGKDDDKSTETVINEKAKKLKVKIRNIIDEIITNPNVGDWFIDLKTEFVSSYNRIIKKLNTAVETLRANQAVEKQQMLLADVPLLEKKIISKVNKKFASLKDLIINKFKESNGIDASNLNFDLDSIVPKLTNLNGKQVIEAIAILETKKNDLSGSSNSMSKHSGYVATSEEVSLFKVKTNLRYNFKIAGVLFEDEYFDAELLITGNSDEYKKNNNFINETIAKIFSDYNNVKIYGDDNKKIEGNIGNLMNWDFSEKYVLDEIQSMQFEQLKETEGNESLKKNLTFKSADDIEFKIDSSQYMKFNNHDIDLKRSGENNILVKQGTDKLQFNIAVMKDEKEAVTTLKKQFFSDNEKYPEKWNGGKINHDFMEEVKKYGVGSHPRINLDEYYGLGDKPDDEKYDSSIREMLIGYGTTTIKNVSYAGIPLDIINIDTNITVHFSPGMKKLYENLEKYVETIVKSLKGDMRIGHADENAYFLEWQFPNKGEWDVIKAEITKKTGDGTITFNWIMDHVLKDVRILGKKEEEKYEFPIDSIPKDAWSFLKTVNEVKYKQREKEDFLTTEHGYSIIAAPLYVKYGPFVVYLTGDDLVTNFEGYRNWGSIGRTF